MPVDCNPYGTEKSACQLREVSRPFAACERVRWSGHNKRCPRVLPATARPNFATIRDQVTNFALPYRQYPWTTCHHTSSEAGTGLMPFGCLFRNGSTRRRSRQTCLLDFCFTPHGSFLRQVWCTTNEATCCGSIAANHSCVPAAHPFTAEGCLCAP